jgi:hypothetical protein
MNFVRVKMEQETIIYSIFSRPSQLNLPTSPLHHQTISLPLLPSPTPASYTNNHASPSPTTISTMIKTIERIKEKTVTTLDLFFSIFG